MDRVCPRLGRLRLQSSRAAQHWRLRSVFALLMALRPAPGVAQSSGPRTIEQLEASTRALDVTIDDDTRATLDDLFPPVGKGGPGPEAWAW